MDTESPAPIEDVDAETSLLIHKEGWRYPFTLALAFLLGAGIFFLIYRSDHAIISLTQNDGTLVFPFLPFLFVLLGTWFKFATEARREMLNQLATTLSYTYSQSLPNDSVSGTLFTLGHSRRILDALTGTYNGMPISIFTYYYTIGYGKEAETYSHAVFYVTLPYVVPHIIFNHHDLGNPSDLEKVDLEGDFNRRFTLQVAKGKQMEIRELFQPNVMLAFENDYSEFGFEATGNVLYLMHTVLPLQRERFLGDVATAQHLIDVLLPGLQEISNK